ncbi:hypothetical protein FCULG_00006400 [Fusarium culmorum]|uniref:Uncharacterized protein n=1 Tax=Fusarium culmorum TaxID=5516 RepID=A0A2T4GXW1_FUSCU|nr:hypothetical protein FCULG_00006400 [Fusarium culmorum]
MVFSYISNLKPPEIILHLLRARITTLSHLQYTKQITMAPKKSTHEYFTANDGMYRAFLAACKTAIRKGSTAWGPTTGQLAGALMGLQGRNEAELPTLGTWEELAAGSIRDEIRGLCFYYLHTSLLERVRSTRPLIRKRKVKKQKVSDWNPDYLDTGFNLEHSPTEENRGSHQNQGQIWNYEKAYQEAKESGCVIPTQAAIFTRYQSESEFDKVTMPLHHDIITALEERNPSYQRPKEAFAIAEDHELDDLSKNNDKLDQGVARFLDNYSI